MFLFKIIGGVGMAGFGGRQIPKQLARRRIRRRGSSSFVEPLRVALHDMCFFANAFQAKVFDQPDRPARIEPGHVFPPDQRDGRAEARLVQVDQPTAMLVLFLGHPIENSGRSGKFLSQHLGIAAVDAGIILFRGNREGEDLLLAEILETAS